MNWENIKKKQPKAIELLDGWILTNHPDVSFSKIFYYLSYFFDEQGIYIEGTVDAGYFSFDIVDKNNSYLSVQKVKRQTRTEAEEPAFEKAFEILENKL